MSFEFIIILAVLLLLCFAIMSDFFEESTDSFVLTAARQSAEHYASVKPLSDANCIGMKMDSFGFQNGVIKIAFNKCPPAAPAIADDVEKSQCNAVPNSDSAINCGSKTYQVAIS
ncbi:MAG: hypothetical protein QXO69_00635 [archaeon]